MLQLLSKKTNCIVLGDFGFKDLCWRLYVVCSKTSLKFLKMTDDNHLTQKVLNLTYGNSILSLITLNIDEQISGSNYIHYRKTEGSNIYILGTSKE